MEDIQQQSHDTPASMRGNSPADLHVYREGRRMSGDGSPKGFTNRVRQQLPEIDERGLAKALGWFSVALGVAEVVAPRQLGRAIGMDRNYGLLRAFGLREIASGVGILAGQQRPGWLWSRVAGDAMDLAILGAAMRSGRNNRTRLIAATAAVAGVTALDVYAGERMRRHDAAGPRDQAQTPREAVRESVGVNASPEECYRQWRNVENLPRFMRHVESVQATGDRTSRWTVKAPAGARVEFDSEITVDEPNRMLSWESRPGSDVEHRGSVHFDPAPGGRGTIVRVEMSYDVPGGKLAAMAAKVTGEDPQQQVREGLRRFRQLLETGEIATTDGQSAGRRGKVYNLFKKERAA